MKALLDTSYFVAREQGRPSQSRDDIDETFVSVITVAELTLGVLMAGDDDRPARIATLSEVQRHWEPLPVDVDVAREFARLVADQRRRGRRAPLLDAIIAATASAHDLTVVTQDRDYGAFDGLPVITV